MMEVNINEIIVQGRIRQNIGWLDSLERSIQQVGVLQPIGITADKHLIFGGRRLQACKNIGLKTIPVRVFDIAADDPITALRMEREENEHRADLTPSEKVEIAKRIEEAVAGRQGGDRKSKGKILPLENEPQGKSADIAAKSVDMNRETYRQAKAVVDSGDNELIHQMDTGKKSIHAAYKSIPKPEPPQLKPAIQPQIEEPVKEPQNKPFKPASFIITLNNNPDADAAMLLAKGGNEYCTKLAIAILKAAGHNITVDGN